MSDTFEMAPGARTLVAEIKALLATRVRRQKSNKSDFEQIRSKVVELKSLVPNFSDAQIGELVGQTARWVARVAGAKTPAAKAHTLLLKQLRRSRDSIAGERDIGLLSSLQSELAAMAASVEACLALAKGAQQRRKAG